MFAHKKTVLFFIFLCFVAITTAQPIKTPEAESAQKGFLTQLLLAPLTLAHFCFSAHSFIKRNQLAREVVTSKNEIDSYQVNLLALKKNTRTILRSKTYYNTTFSGLNLHKVVHASIAALKKTDPKLLIIAKPSITTDAGPWYMLKSFTGYAAQHEKFKEELLDVFFVPEHETLTKQKKIATAVAPLALGGLVALFLVL